MFVKIFKASKQSYWYAGTTHMGAIYEVKDKAKGEDYELTDLGDPRLIKTDDCRVLSLLNESAPSIPTPAGLTLIAPGSRGKVGEISILITQVHIESHQVEYTIAWWNEGQRYTERVPEYEITDAERTMKVGFE